MQLEVFNLLLCEYRIKPKNHNLHINLFDMQDQSKYNMKSTISIPLKKPKKKMVMALFLGATLHLSAPSAQSLASLPALYCYHHPLRYAYVFQLAPSHRQEGVAQVVNALHIQP